MVAPFVPVQVSVYERYVETRPILSLYVVDDEVIVVDGSFVLPAVNHPV